MNQEVCSKCLKPKAGKAASITQWISVCACDLVGSTEEFASTRPHCLNCGKVIAENRSGSMTQWVFGQTPCNCETPRPDRKSETFHTPAFEPEEEDPYEVELETEPSKFPSERYKPLEVLGTGVSGSVYLSRDRLLKKRVAVKVLKTMESFALISFQNEARTTSKLNHPNIVRVLDFGVTDGGVPFMVMDLVPGISIDEFLKTEGPLNAASAISVFARLADALDYAHDSGILHRDLKPSNIIIADTDDGIDVHLIDFGVAKIQEQLKTTLVDGTALVGTPAYMSPDQALGNPFDQRSDIYSLGCILYEALTGEPPFSADSPLEVISLHAHEAPPSLLDHLEADETVEALNEIVSTCMSKDPKHRYQNAQAFKQALLAVPAQGGLFQNFPTASPAVPTSEPAIKSDKLLLIGGCLVGLVLIVGFSIYFYNSLVETPNNSDVREHKISHAVDDKDQYSLEGVRSKTKFLLTPIEGNKLSLVAEVSATDEALKKAVSEHPNISAVDFSHSDVTPEGLTCLQTINIETIKYPEKELLMSDFKALSKLVTLRSLALTCTGALDEKGLDLLRDLPRLQQLNFSYSNLTPKLFSRLSALKSVQKLSLAHCTRIDQVDLSTLPPNVIDLDLDGTALTSKNIQQILKLKQLVALSLNGTSVTDEMVVTLAGLPNIKVIGLMDCPKVTDKAVHQFKQRTGAGVMRPNLQMVIED